MKRPPPIKQKSRAAIALADTGKNLRHQESYPAPDALQDAALEIVRELEERTLSALWHGLPGTFGNCNAAGLDDADHFAFRCHGELFRCLMICGLHGFQPTIADLLAVMQYAFPDSLIRHFDQLARIWLTTSSSACLWNWARLVFVAARRRKQVARLWLALRDRIADPIGDAPGKSVSVPINRAMCAEDRPRFSARALAAVFEGAGDE